MKYQNLQAAVFDWAGTTIDFGSFAPMGALMETFASFGVDIGIEEARAPMGMRKRDHVAAILAMPRVAGAWEEARGTAVDEIAVDAVYAAFLPRNLEVAAAYGDPIEGIPEVIGRLKMDGLKIGSTTGYTREIMERVLPAAAAAVSPASSILTTATAARGGSEV